MDMKVEVRPGRLLNIEIDKNPKSQTTIFLIHGLGGRSKQWREQVKYLRDKYTLIIPDLLGHGASAKPQPDKNNPYDFVELSQDLQIIFDKYADEKNIVMGHSYGGALAAYLTLRNQQKIEKLVLLAPTPCRPSAPKMIFHLPVFMLEMLRPYFEKNFQKMAYDNNSTRDLLKEEGLAGKNNPLYVIKYMMLGMEKIPDVDIGQLETPTLLIAGETDELVTPERIRNFYGKLPHGEFVQMAKAAHMMMLEKPLEVTQLIADFIGMTTMVVH
jgi:pimeloyl-ACP methyl ester carboxylesterase